MLYSDEVSLSATSTIDDLLWDDCPPAETVEENEE